MHDHEHEHNHEHEQSSIPADSTVSSEELLSLATSCELFSTHPIAVSIVNAANEQSLAVERPSGLKEIAGHGIQASVAAGTLLCGNADGVQRRGPFGLSQDGLWHRSAECLLNSVRILRMK